MKMFLLSAITALTFADLAAAKETVLRSLVPSENPLMATHEMMNDESMAVPLDEAFDVFFFHDHVKSSENVPTAKQYCYTGDVGRVCSLLARMSDLSEKNYLDGIHQRAKLKNCRILRSEKAVEARVEMLSDWLSPEGIKTIAVIGRCAL
jgi:hypothetical protein